MWSPTRFRFLRRYMSLRCLSRFGVVLLIVVAIGMESSFVEIDENNAKLKVELEALKKEIAELKNNGKNQNTL